MADHDFAGLLHVDLFVRRNVPQRMAHQLLRRAVPFDVRPSSMVKAALQRVFAAERHMLGRVNFPIELPLYAVLSA